MQPVLVVAAHPDDEVLGCGGTIAKLATRQPIHLAILGEGISSRSDVRGDAEPSDLDRLRKDAHAVASRLGACDLTLEGLPDNRFDQLALLDVVKRVERLIERIQPEAVYTHHPGDLNIDHRITFQAVLTATRPVVGCPVRGVYAFEIPSSTEWAFQRIEPTFRPNVFVDISATISLKVESMKLYTTECRAFPHPRSPETLLAIARRWGSVIGVEYAEAFELIRLVRL